MINLDNKLFLRKVSLQVVSNAGTEIIDNLRIAFDIEKTNESVPNPAHIKIYNLSDKNRAMVEDYSTRVILSAGYQNTCGIIFSGNVVRTKHKKVQKLQSVTHRYEDVDIITEIEAADGGNRYRNAYTLRSYPPGAKLVNIVQDLVNDLGLPANVDYSALPQNVQYIHGYSIGQDTRYALDNICKTYGLEWSIQNETVQIISKDKTIKTEIIILNSKTGLVSSPIKTSAGCDFETLLYPALTPGCPVKIESKFVNGIFKIQKVIHIGDSHDGDFLSKCEATYL